MNCEKCGRWLVSDEDHTIDDCIQILGVKVRALEKLCERIENGLKSASGDAYQKRYSEVDMSDVCAACMAAGGWCRNHDPRDARIDRLRAVVRLVSIFACCECPCGETTGTKELDEALKLLQPGDLAT